MAFVLALAREVRVLQWIKNLAVFAAITFTGQLFNAELFKLSAIAFIVFCLLSSAVYIVNDIFDLTYDRVHPIKKYRPIAAGVIPLPVAIFIAVLLATLSLALSFNISLAFFLLVAFFLTLHLSYSIVLKHIAIIDILVIAAGYFLRVVGGELATGFHVSAWLVITAVSLSLFLAIGKRRVELSLLSGNVYQKVRRSLTNYSEKLLDEYLSVFATATFISYSLFTFLDKTERAMVDWERKWLMATIPFVIFGLMRYMQDVYEKKMGERPEKVLLTDKLLLLNVVLWIITVIVILYFFPFT